MHRSVKLDGGEPTTHNHTQIHTHLEIDFCRSGRHTQTKGGGVDTAITLTNDVEVIVGEVWKLHKETLQR